VVVSADFEGVPLPSRQLSKKRRTPRALVTSAGNFPAAIQGTRRDARGCSGLASRARPELTLLARPGHDSAAGNTTTWSESGRNPAPLNGTSLRESSHKIFGSACPPKHNRLCKHPLKLVPFCEWPDCKQNYEQNLRVSLSFAKRTNALRGTHQPTHERFWCVATHPTSSGSLMERLGMLCRNRGNRRRPPLPALSFTCIKTFSGAFCAGQVKCEARVHDLHKQAIATARTTASAPPASSGTSRISLGTGSRQRGLRKK
jgi:hypothetical protein